jgi:uncharacterized membrane protein YhfC
MQVSIFSIVFMAISAIISIGLPIVLFVVFYKKYNAKFLPMIFGIAGFIIFVLILERSIHSIVFGNFALREMPALYVIYGIFMAGIFEETARFISFNILKRKYNGIGTGLAYGIGHGGIEAVLLAGLSMVNAIITSIIVNAGKIETITGKLQGEILEQTNRQISTLATTASYLFLISGVERIFAIGIQISLSIIVFYAVYGRNKKWLFPLAIILHAIIDIPAAAMQVGLLKNTVLVEGLVCLGAILAIIIAKYIHKEIKNGVRVNGA